MKDLFKYKMIAENRAGSIVQTYGDTVKECVDKFDREYCRSGWKINVYGNQDYNQKYFNVIRSTYI